MNTDPHIRIGVADYGRRIILSIDGQIHLLRPATAIKLADDLEDAADAILDHAGATQ